MYAVRYETFGTVYDGQNQFATEAEALEELQWFRTFGYVNRSWIVYLP